MTPLPALLNLARVLDWGTVPAWFGAVGTALAFAGLLREVHLRRVDDAREHAERRDAEKSQARLVYYKITGLLPHQLRLAITNAGSSLALDIGVALLRGADQRTANIKRRHPNVSTLGPNESGDAWLTLDEATEPQMTDGEDVAIVVSFTDANGLRWRRVDNGEPERVLYPSP